MPDLIILLVGALVALVVLWVANLILNAAKVPAQIQQIILIILGLIMLLIVLSRSGLAIPGLR